MRIAGLGRYLPQRRVASAEIEARAGLAEGWALQHSGVAFRHWAEPERERASWMGAQAALQACERAGIAPEQVELIVNASGSAERAIPDGGPLLQRELGLGRSGIPALSVHATCLSFVAAVEMAAERIHHGRIERALVVSSEIASVGLNFADAEVCTLFGDGAAAAVLERAPDDSPSRIHRVAWRTLGEGVELTTLRGGGSWRPPLGASTRPEDAYFSMQGPAALRSGIRLVPHVMRALALEDRQARRELRWVVSHQASRAALEVIEQIGFDHARLVRTLEQTGNCIAASIPLALEQGVREGAIRRGERGVLLGTGAGLSGVGMTLTY
ncbi:ketoacyl-ACP synthase III [Lysobacter sp. BMK333-48F3]|uniref:3-oxoacyl-[acyl-carrier-protein] synthase III C-terminal domain-containing protein n=1 Tax=Lysobacter sp. BMK333-48F3 TaxID=2867962 RepID=UPI001C8C0BF9|nr:ketoacyl-ACP synthase III [Lysobacter sp. BMK333-48F3]